VRKERRTSARVAPTTKDSGGGDGIIVMVNVVVESTVPVCPAKEYVRIVKVMLPRGTVTLTVQVVAFAPLTQPGEPTPTSAFFVG